MVVPVCRGVILGDLLGFCGPFLVAGRRISVIVIRVRAVTLAVARGTAVDALSLANPLAVAGCLGAFFPRFRGVVFVGVTLVRVATGAKAQQSQAVYRGEDCASAYVAKVGVVACFAFVFARGAFAAVARISAPLFPCLLGRFRSSNGLLIY